MRTIYAAENRLNYILDFLDERIHSDGTLYAKSRERYQNLLKNLTQATDMVYTILEDSFIAEVEPNDNFDRTLTVDSELSDIVNDMKAALEKFQMYTADSNSIGQMTSDSGVVESHVDNPSKHDDLSELKQHDNRISSDERVDLLKIMNEGIDDCVNECNKVSQGLVRYDYVKHAYLYKHLGDMLHDWYYKRIKGLRPRSSDFRYNAKFLSIYASDIVMAFGEAIHNNTAMDFVKQFNHWIAEVECGTNSYIIPYIVKQVQDDRTMHWTPEGFEFLCGVCGRLSSITSRIWGHQDILKHKLPSAIQLLEDEYKYLDPAALYDTESLKL